MIGDILFQAVSTVDVEGVLLLYERKKVSISFQYNKFHSMIKHHPQQFRIFLFFLCCHFLLTSAPALGWSAVSIPTEATSRGYTQADVTLLVLYMFFALFFSFLCSIAEAVLLSITPSFIAGLREKKPRLAALVKRLKHDKVDQSLAAILTLNTIAHTVGAIGSGAKATVIFGSAWFGLFSAIMTLMILFLSEIIPKTLGAVFWRRLAGVTAYFVRWLIILLYPLILVTEGLTRLISRQKKGITFCRDEFVALAGIGERAGMVHESETRIIRNLFRFSRLKAKDIMTPRTVIFAFQEEMTVSEALELKPDSPFSRIPLYNEDMDDIEGFILKSDMLLSKAQDKDDIKLKTLKREMMSVPSEMSLSSLLESLLDRRHHIALVVGEYGETKGLVTLEDVVETLLGMEIIDEADKVVDMQALARKQWEKRAKALGLEIELPPEGEEQEKSSGKDSNERG